MTMDMTSLGERLLHVADWLRIEAPLLPPSVQMAEFAAAAATLEALAEEARAMEDRERIRRSDRYYAADKQV